MKSFVLSALICIPFLSHSQIIFEHVSSPNDFSIGAVRKSPIGEYFVQAQNDDHSIYTSIDGIEWNRAPLPVEHPIYEIQYFSDGAPLLKSERREHLIRRNGSYYTMDAGGGDLVEASFIKDDTLFMYHDNRFAYSLDRGQTFTTIFSYSGNLIDHTARLWKFDRHFVLHHTAGTKDHLSVFNMNGERVLSDTFNIFFSETITYNSCGEILFNDEDSFYLLKEEGLIYQIGPVGDIVPQFGYDTDLLSEGGHYYFRNDNTIYKSSGCNFDWQFFAADDLIGHTSHIWFSHTGEIFLYSTGQDFFTVETNGTAVKHYPDIPHAYVTDVDESINGDQFSRTLNAMFSKHEEQEEWMESDSILGYNFKIQYSPGGELYINRMWDIIYSADNGESFSSIPLPPVNEPFEVQAMEVMGDGVLFIFGNIYVEGYYTFNYGQDWIHTSVMFQQNEPKIKMVDGHILIVFLDFFYKVSRINIATNEKTTESLGDFSSAYMSNSALSDDGTLFFRNDDDFSSKAEGLYRYRFGEELEFLGFFPLQESHTLVSSGNDLFALGKNDYYKFNGSSFSERRFLIGLPQEGRRNYIMAQNEHLYVIVDNQHIFRSTEPLSMTIATNKVSNDIDFKIYPNPTNDKLAVTVSETDLHRIDTYEIIDQLGQRINLSAFENHQKINVDRLAPGLYNLLLKENGVVVGVKKFVKM